MNKRIVYCVLGFHAVVALFAPLLPLAPTDEQNPGAMLQGFSTAHWLGTDALGRDVLSRALHGGRPSLVIALIATALSAIIGVALGSLAALAGGWIDEALARLIDFLLAAPTLILLLLIASFFGHDPFILVSLLV